MIVSNASSLLNLPPTLFFLQSPALTHKACLCSLSTKQTDVFRWALTELCMSYERFSSPLLLLFLLCLTVSPDGWHHNRFVSSCVLQGSHPCRNNEVKKETELWHTAKGNSLTALQSHAHTHCAILECTQSEDDMESETVCVISIWSYKLCQAV